MDIQEFSQLSTFLSSHPQYKQICLQFPNDMLKYSGKISLQLSAAFSTCQFHILADTQYGSCCVDEVAAEHSNTELIVHYGDACMSRPSRLPVYFVFNRASVDKNLMDDFISKLNEHVENNEGKTITIISDLKYHWCFDDFRDINKNVHFALIPSRFIPAVNVTPSNTDNSIFKYMGRILYKPKEQFSSNTDEIVYFGDSNQFISLLSMDFYGVDLFDTSLTALSNSSKLNKYLFKRYAGIEKAKESDIIGILVGTLGVAEYGTIISRLRALITNAGKKPYVVLVGKLNPAKLANFAEIPLFVLVSCPMNSFIDDMRDYYQHIVTPYELEVALGAREWDPSKYQTSFSSLLQQEETSPSIHSESSGADEVQEKVLLESSCSQDLIPVDGVGALTLSGLDLHLSRRTWNGLDMKESEKPVTLATDGRRGFAQQYSQ